MASRRVSKYNAQPVVVDGIRFDSKAEAARYADLTLMQRAGRIQDLVLQPAFALHAEGGHQVGTYRADFQYVEGDQLVVEDVKGFKTELYKWKKKHVEAEYGLTLRETTRPSASRSSRGKPSSTNAWRSLSKRTPRRSTTGARSQAAKT